MTGGASGWIDAPAPTRTATSALSFLPSSSLLKVDKSTASRVVGSLREQGWVERKRDPEDSRNYLLGLTEEGKAAAARLAKARREGHARLLARLAPDERESLAKGLEALTRALENEEQAPQ